MSVKLLNPGPKPELLPNNSGGLDNSLTAITREMGEKLEAAEKNRKEDTDKLQKENDKLSKKNGELLDRIGQLNGQLTDLTWKSFRRPGQQNTVLLGDGQLKRISSYKIKGTEMVLQEGADIAQISDEIEKLPRGYDNAILLVGGEDCDIPGSSTAADIVKSYKELVLFTKDKARRVTVSSVPPRLGTNDTTEKIAAVNAGLLQMCKNGADFVDNSAMFILGDGSVNDGYFEPDGKCITERATLKLARNIGLSVTDGATDEGDTAGRAGIYRDTWEHRQNARRSRATPESHAKRIDRMVRETLV